MSAYKGGTFSLSSAWIYHFCFCSPGLRTLRLHQTVKHVPGPQWGPVHGRGWLHLLHDGVPVQRLVDRNPGYGVSGQSRGNPWFVCCAFVWVNESTSGPLTKHLNPPLTSHMFRGLQALGQRFPGPQFGSATPGEATVLVPEQLPFDAK